MTEYQKTYIELKKQFVATNDSPDSIRALYAFKEELEQSEDQQAKEVLVEYMTCWTLRRTPTNCSAKSEIVPIKRPSSGWAR